MRWSEVAAAQPPTPAPVIALGKKRQTQTLLSVDNLSLSYAQSGWFTEWLGKKTIPIARDIDLELHAGEIVALVGESGSGKSTIARAISGRLAPVSGSISVDGQALATTLAGRSVQQLKQIQYIFQNPDASLNPRRSIQAILQRPLQHFGIELKPDTLEKVLESVGLHAGYLNRYPEQLSGGERQRVAIARALLVNPKLLICDEILSALDVSVQTRIVELLLVLKEQHSVAMLFISHDLAVVRQLADKVAVLYRGELMQMVDTDALFSSPLHPYTEMLLHAAPGLCKDDYVPQPPAMPDSRSVAGKGCPLAGRCPRQLGALCAESNPPSQKTQSGFIRCHIPVAELAHETGNSPKRTDAVVTLSPVDMPLYPENSFQQRDQTRLN